MKVRDRTRKLSEYKGRWTDASDAKCPCRPCYNPHDCGRLNSQGKWTENMECATRWNSGCPSPKPSPQHVFSPMGRVCKRCRATRAKPTQGKEKRCWSCGKKRPHRKPASWWTFMGWGGPKGERKLYVLYGCEEHHEGMEEAFQAYRAGEWKPKHERTDKEARERKA